MTFINNKQHRFFINFQRTHKIRKVAIGDLAVLSTLVNAHGNELGFIRRVTLEYSIDQKEIIVAELDEQVVGFVRYHHRRDSQTTLYDIVVSPAQRHAGIGKALVYALVTEAMALGKQVVVLKCPIELVANGFYAHIGFERLKEEPGKGRRLVIWGLRID